MLFTASGSLPKHLYVSVDGAYVGSHGAHNAVWFGLHSHVGRAWGCTVLLESGAVYRNLPPHALFWGPTPAPWTIEQAQLWDCYSPQFSTHTYTYLDGLSAIAKVCGQDVPCTYLFTAIPVGDGFTEEPSQDKEFMFLKTAYGRLTIQPTNRVRFVDKSFTDTEANWPKLGVQTFTYSCEA